jgi:RNA polymerase sigma factor (sigma-70 family)
MESLTNRFARFEQLYADTCIPVFRFFFTRVPHGETAEDLTSETFLKAAHHWPPRALNGTAAKGWLFTIARNLLTDYYRVAKRYTLVQLDDRLPAQPYTDLGGEGYAEKLSIQIAIPMLSPRDQTVLSLRLAGLSNREIADSLGMSEGAAAMACLRALGRLQKQLGIADG